MNTLLIWEEVPETIKLYVIPNDVAEQYLTHLEQAHQKYINTEGWDSNTGLLFLNTALIEDDTPAEVGFEQYAGVLNQYKVNSDKPLQANISRVFVSGFML